MSELIIGRNPLIEALKAGRPIDRILLERNARNQGSLAEILRLAREQHIPIDYAERPVLDARSATSAHQGVLAYVAAKDYVNLDDLLAISREKQEPPLYVMLDGIEDPHNLGAILRTAEATGAHGVIIRERRAVGLTPAVVKASAGAVEYMPVARVNNIAQAIEALKKANIWVVGIDMAGQTEYSRVDYTAPTALVIGAEGKGLSDLVRKRCDILAYIPMKGKIASLNASVAAAVVLYAALKQREG